MRTFINPKTGAELRLSGTALSRREYYPLPGSIETEYELPIRLDNMMAAGKEAGVFPDQLAKMYARNELSHELAVDLLEIKTNPPHLDIRSMVAELKRRLQYVLQIAQWHNLRLLPISCDPFSAISNIDVGYDFIRRIVTTKHGIGPALLNTNAGLQFTVDIGDGNAAIFVHNALRRVVPHLVALTANSPFFCGGLAGVKAMRPSLRSALHDGTWVAEEIQEESWGEYIENRIKMCQIGSVMSVPWAHNGPIRIRPDHRTLAIELAMFEIPHTLAQVEALAHLAQRLVHAFAILYKKGESLPHWVCASQHMAIQKSMQEAVLHGTSGTFITSDLTIMTFDDALGWMLDFLNPLRCDDSYRWETLARPELNAMRAMSPADKLIAAFHGIHQGCDVLQGCSGCATTIQEVMRDLSIAFETEIRFN